MQYIALFGPPGVGKSTLIYLAKQQGISAVDLERLGDSYSERKEALQKIINEPTNENILLGAADIRISDLPRGAITILLLPPFGEYVERMRYRDSDYPSKAGQKAVHAYHSFQLTRHQFAFVYSDISSPESLLNDIKERFRI